MIVCVCVKGLKSKTRTHRAKKDEKHWSHRCFLKRASTQFPMQQEPVEKLTVKKMKSDSHKHFHCLFVIKLQDMQKMHTEEIG